MSPSPMTTILFITHSHAHVFEPFPCHVVVFITSSDINNNYNNQILTVIVIISILPRHNRNISDINGDCLQCYIYNLILACQMINAVILVLFILKLSTARHYCASLSITFSGVTKRPCLLALSRNIVNEGCYTLTKFKPIQCISDDCMP